jgi:hypothetical protein
MVERTSGKKSDLTGGLKVRSNGERVSVRRRQKCPLPARRVQHITPEHVDNSFQPEQADVLT